LADRPDFSDQPVGHSPSEAAEYLARGFWSERTLADYVSHWRASRPDGLAFAGDEVRMTWSQYDRLSTRLAGDLVAAGLRPGDRVATVLDGPEAHVAWLAAEKAGLVAVGIGSRAGEREIAHLLAQTGSSAVLSVAPPGASRAEAAVVAARSEGRPIGHMVMGQMTSVDEWPVVAVDPPPDGEIDGPVSRERAPIGSSDVFFLNSTSGTTGLPKCVMHTQNRWAYFHQVAVDAGELTADDVFCSALPAPFGFGLWTAHFTPTYLGAPCHVRRRFDAESFLNLLAQERVTVLAAVTTQLIMLLNCPALAGAELSALRVIFTGGEAVPYDKAAQFEDRTGAKVLQFYGSNETGAASRTTTRDSRWRRLTTAGRTIDEMRVRLLDPVSGRPVDGHRGQPACRGPATCEGYYNDPDANAELYTSDGWMLMGDLVEIDSEGYLTVVGRTSDIIIRGGKNISATAVEAEVMTHSAVALAAAVAVPDPVFGERVGVYVELQPDAQLTLEELRGHLETRGVTREWFPERLVVVDQIPRSSGGKIAKGQLRADIQARGETG
jgi:acyl-CoA synthetase